MVRRFPNNGTNPFTDNGYEVDLKDSEVSGTYDPVMLYMENLEAKVTLTSTFTGASEVRTDDYDLLWKWEPATTTPVISNRLVLCGHLNLKMPKLR